MAAITRLRMFRFQNAVHFHRPLSTLAADKRLKTVDELPGHINLFGLGAGLRILLAKLVTRKSFGALALEAQFDETKKFGPIYKFGMPGLKIVNLSDPVEVAKVLRNEPKYPMRFDAPAMNYYYKLRNTVPGVFFANGEDWYRYRTTVSKRILKPKEVAEYLPIFNEIITDFITRLDSIRSPPGTDNSYEVEGIDNELFKWSFESVSHVLFDRRFGCLENEVNPDAQDFINSVGEFLHSIVVIGMIPVWFHKIYETKVFKDFVYHFDNMYKYADRFIDETVKDVEIRRGQSNAADSTAEKVGFVEYLLFQRQLSKRDLMASMIDLFFAGVDTTSNTMQWFLYTMAKNPDKQKKLFQEISTALAEGELPSSNSLAKMPYLKACFKETLRLYPLLSTSSRTIQEDMEILGYLIPKGTMIQFLHYYMSNCEDYFPNAKDFLPERWMRNEQKGTKDTEHAFASIPFGFGTRMCAGRRIAELEMYLLAVRLIQKYKLEYPSNEVVEPFMRVVTIPDRPVRVKFIDRQ